MGEPAVPELFGPLLIAADFAATLTFYRDRLGMPFAGESPYAECVSPQAKIAIVDGRFWSKLHGSEMGVYPGTAVPPVTVLAIRVDDVDAHFERLMSLAIRFLAPPTDQRAMGLRNAFLRDPDGRTVELTSPLGPPRAA